MEEKRNLFPRLYFLGDEDLLEILGNSENIKIMNNHISKIFGSVSQLSQDKNNSINEVISEDVVNIIEKLDLR